jgi:multicomponent Na+:H+ antiporter subunit D
MSSPIEWLILLPFAGGAVAFLIPGRARPWFGLGITFATLATAAWLVRDVWESGPMRYDIGGWQAPLGIGLYADGLSALLVATTVSVMSVAACYALGYFSRAAAPAEWTEGRAFVPLWLMLLGSLNALFLSADLFNLYVALELLTMAGVGLVALAGDATALRASMRYLLAAFLASLLYLLGVALLYGEFGVLDLQLVGAAASNGGAPAIPIALLFAGLAIKAALFPFHAWLPGAHASAPAPVSAVLSALVVKGGFDIVLRLWTDIFTDSVTMQAAQAVGALGAAGILWGSLQALREQRLKLVVAHSTVAQVGYLFLLFPLLSTGDQAEWQFNAWAGGVYHVVSHAFAKSALFLCAGTILYAYGNDQISAMRGLTKTLPITTAAFGIAGVALVGLPPSGSFVAKWMLLTATIESAQWWWTVVIGVGTLLSGAYVYRLLRTAFTPDTLPEGMRPVPRLMEYSTLALAVTALALGLRAAELFDLLRAGAPFLVCCGGGW